MLLVRTRILILLLWLSLPLEATVSLSLVSPNERVSPGAETEVSVLAENRSDQTVALTLDRNLAATLEGRDVQLDAVEAAPETIAARDLLLIRYRLWVPETATGELVLRLEGPGEIQPSCLIEIRDGIKFAPQITSRLDPYRPTYLLFGGEGQSAQIKFQFSLKYKLLGWEEAQRKPMRSIQFGFTQQSIWNVGDQSNPFYDSTYQPEFYYEHILRRDARANNPNSAVQLSFLHTSNGRGQPDGSGESINESRHFNRVVVRTRHRYGDPDGWHFIVEPELWFYVGDLSDNPTIDDFLGYGRLRLTFGNADHLTASLVGHYGSGFERFSHQVDLIRHFQLRPKFPTDLSVLVQYFYGYGESLLDYDQRNEAVRIGLSFHY